MICLVFGFTACGGEAAEVAPTPEVTAEPTPAPTPTPTPVPTPASDSELVLLTDWLPGLYVDLKYATTDNFTGQVIYDFTQPSLRWGTVQKLMQVQQALAQQGYGLLVWDGYRPPAAQFKLWEIYPDANFVANPNVGFSSHSRGNTVDLTLVQIDGTPVEMPSAFDEFGAAADRDYSDVSAEAAQNAKLLEDTMVKYGFKPYVNEWWHFTDTTEYAVAEQPHTP